MFSRPISKRVSHTLIQIKLFINIFMEIDYIMVLSATFTVSYL